MLTIPFLQRQRAGQALMIAVAMAVSICSWPSALAASAPDGQDAEHRIQELQATQRQLLEQVRQELMSLPRPSGVSSNDPEQARQEARRRQLLKLLAEIERRIAEEGHGRTRFVSSGTKDPALQSYYGLVSRRIEEEGTKSFPKDGNQPLYGKAIIQFTVSANGKVEKISVERSDSKKIAAHAISLLRRLGPFEPFPEALASQVDQLVIVAPFTYGRTGM